MKKVEVVLCFLFMLISVMVFKSNVQADDTVTSKDGMLSIEEASEIGSEGVVESEVAEGKTVNDSKDNPYLVDFNNNFLETDYKLTNGAMFLTGSVGIALSVMIIIFMTITIKQFSSKPVSVFSDLGSEEEDEDEDVEDTEGINMRLWRS